MSTSSASSLYFGSDCSSAIKKKAGKPSSYWETALSWLTNKEINIYMRLCMWGCIWVSYRGCVNRYVIPVPVCTHGTPPFLSECIFLTPQWNQSVFIRAKKENPLHGPIRVAECMFITRVRVVRCVSFTLPKQLTDPFVPQRKSYNITATIRSLKTGFCL